MGNIQATVPRDAFLIIFDIIYLWYIQGTSLHSVMKQTRIESQLAHDSPHRNNNPVSSPLRLADVQWQ